MSPAIPSGLHHAAAKHQNPCRPLLCLGNFGLPSRSGVELGLTRFDALSDARWATFQQCGIYKPSIPTCKWGLLWPSQVITPSLSSGSFIALSGSLTNANVCAVASGLSTSLLLETVLLKFGRDRLSWLIAARTAFGMSMISMITMELVENFVDYNLTGGVVQLNDPMFWVAAVVSMTAGFLAPLPYNYHRLKKFGKACH